jgi:8-amino-7-oxononanoate synthase
MAAIRASVRYFSKQHGLRAKLAELIDYFHKTAPGVLPRVPRPFSAIQTILIPGNAQVKAVAAACREKKLDARAILSPTVPEGQERLRVILHAFNTKTEIDELIKIVAEAPGC